MPWHKYSRLSNNCAAQFINFLEKSILHTLIPSFTFLWNCQHTLHPIFHLLLHYGHFLCMFLLKFVKILFLQTFVSNNLKIYLPLLLLVKESKGCFYNFPSRMLYSILHTLSTFEKFPSCPLYSICTII